VQELLYHYRVISANKFRGVRMGRGNCVVGEEVVSVLESHRLFEGFWNWICLWCCLSMDCEKPDLVEKQDWQTESS
jgi:hypothetical protein